MTQGVRRKPIEDVTCEHCGALFTPKRRGVRFCYALHCVSERDAARTLERYYRRKAPNG